MARYELWGRLRHLSTNTRMHFVAIFVMQICVTHERFFTKEKKDTEYNSVPQRIMVVEKILYWQKYHFSFREDLVSATPLFLFTSGHAIN